MLVLIDTLKPWQNFYTLLGTASATLVGLLFVAASVGSGVYTRDKHPALRVFLSPTVVHFSTVLAVCLVAMAPVRSWEIAGGLLGITGALGFAYAISVWRSLVRQDLMQGIDWEDRLWYAAIPAFSYVFVIVAGVGFWRRTEMGCQALALGSCLLMIAGIRNAWDMTLWTVMRPRQ